MAYHDWIQFQKGTILNANNLPLLVGEKYEFKLEGNLLITSKKKIRGSIFFTNFQVIFSPHLLEDLRVSNRVNII